MREGPKTKENLDMMKVNCRLCRKQYANKGLWHCDVCLISRQAHVNCCDVMLNLIKNMSLYWLYFVFKALIGLF